MDNTRLRLNVSSNACALQGTTWRFPMYHSSTDNPGIQYTGYDNIDLWRSVELALEPEGIEGGERGGGGGVLALLVIINE